MKTPFAKTRTALRLVLLCLALNLVRYLVGGPIEEVTILDPMFRVMGENPDAFDSDFSTADMRLSYGYNFAMWFVATWVFHLIHPSLGGSWIAKSLQSYGLMCGAFVSLSAVYMNHFTDGMKPFFLWSMVDAVIVFGLVAVANGLLYPLFFRGAARSEGS